MDNQLGKRIERIRENERYGVIEYMRLLGVTKTAYYNWIDGVNLPNSQVLITLLQTFPQYAAEWLLMGIGDMKKDIRSNTSIVMEPESKYGNTITKQQLKKIFEKIAEEIDDM